MVSTRKLVLFTAAVAAVFFCLNAAAESAKTATPRWKPANFHGMTMGKTHREDALRALGRPDAENKTKEGAELTYRARGEHKGDLTVKLSPTALVTEIDEAFPVAIPRTHIDRELGKDAMTAHYSQAACAGNALYRDARGPLELTLYPRLGIVLWPDQYGYDFAAMRYMATQPGLSHPPVCVKR
jgi:hypothetical protein